MKLQRQKPYECFPTVLAMLLDKPVSKVKRELLGSDLAGESWSYLISNRYTPKFAQLRARVSDYLARHLPWLPLESFYAPDLDDCLTLPASGRGVAVINFHVVAFEAGLVYDPQRSAPMPVREYTKELVKRNKQVRLVALEN
jgi:hypothetical protein